MQRETNYQVAVGGDVAEITELMAEARLIHSNESAPNSGYVSVSRCPACLSESTDPAVQKILRASKRVMCQLRIEPRNEPGEPYVFHMGGADTAAVVLLPRGMSLIQFHERFAPPAYVDPFKE